MTGSIQPATSDGVAPAAPADGPAEAQPAAGGCGDFEEAPTGCAVCGAPFRMQEPTPRQDNLNPRQAVPQARPHPQHGGARRK